MKKIKVAFLLNISEDWLGGLNYYKNLFFAIKENEDFGIEPILFVSKDVDMELFKEFPSITIIRTSFMTRWSFLWFIRKLLTKFFNRDFLLEKYLKSKNIDVISHVQDNLSKIKMPISAWIPDFQHKYLPELFSKQDLKGRDIVFENLAKNYDTIILSSNNAKNDFIKFYHEFEDKAEVLQFVVSADKISDLEGMDYLKNKYHIESKFFYLPNQYWIHKNHKIVLEALNILRQENKNVLVVSSGNMHDYRNYQYISSLKQYINDKNLYESYFILGKISYSDVNILGNNCLALINPSLFEGWSTTVEEAKTMGKKIILSNIPVHLEQNPFGGEFFNPKDSRELADKMWKVWNGEKNDNFSQRDRKEENIKRRRKFAETYLDILKNTVDRFENKVNR